MRKTGFHPIQLWLAGTTLAVGLGVLLTVPDRIQRDRLGQLSEMTSKNAVLGRLWFASQVSEWQGTLRAARKSHMANADGSSPVEFKEFAGIVALTQSGVEPWQVAWTEKTSAFEFESSLGDPAFIQELVSGFKSDGGNAADPAQTPRVFLKWIPAGSRAVALSILENPLVSADGARKTQVVLVGFLPVASMDAATRFFRGGVSEFSLLGRDGMIFASNDRAHVGESMAASALSERILREGVTRFEGILSDDTKEELQVASEAVSGTNVVVIAKTPVAAVLKSVQQVKLTLVAFFGGLIFLILLIGRAFIEGVKRKIHQTLEVLEDPASERALKLKARLEKDEEWGKLLTLSKGGSLDSGSTETESVPPSPDAVTAPVTADEIGTETPSAKVELESLEQAGYYLAQCLREPIAASIGHLKLAQGKTAETEANQHLVHVEAEIRRIKEVIEKVQRLGVYKALQTRPADVSGLVRDLLDDISLMSETVGVKIRKSLYPVPKARIAQQDFRDALKVLIQERVIASQSQGKSEMVVGVEPSGSQVVLRIEDRCSAMTALEQSVFLRPLSRSSGYDHQHLKMLAVLSYHDLKIRFENHGPEGNLIVVELPAVEEVEVAPLLTETGGGRAPDAPTRPEPRENGAETGIWTLAQLQNGVETGSSASLDFLESPTTDESEEVGGVSRVEEVREPVISGPLSEYSVKVRKPRLNVPLESKDL